MDRYEDTAGSLYLFFDWAKPKFFVNMDSAREIKNDRLGVLTPPGGWRDYAVLHGWLHSRLGNRCRGIANTKKRRNDGDSEFSGLVRDGCRDTRGCFDTPFFDIDGAWVTPDRRIAKVRENKNRGERFDKSQAATLWNLGQMGIAVEFSRTGWDSFQEVLGKRLCFVCGGDCAPFERTVDDVYLHARCAG